jgi:peptide/nickel transport system substrate-binding protein
MPVVGDGGRTLSFRMRRGVRYSTGEPVRAGDIRRAIERTYDIRDSPGQQYYGAVAGAEACAGKPEPCDLSEGIVADDASGTLVIHLSRPDPNLPYKLALPTAHAVPASAPRAEAKAGLPSTGPYRIARAIPERELLLVRNPHFEEWSSAAQPAAYPDRIHLRQGLEPEAQLAAIRDGRADLVADGYNFPDALLRPLSVAYASRLRANPSDGIEYAFLDTRSAPFDDLRVRRALNMAVDRSPTAGSITGSPTCQVIPPGSVGHARYCPFGLRGDLARARTLVARSGTRGARIRVWRPPGQPATRMELVVKALRRLGYRPAVRSIGFDRYFTMLQSGAPPQIAWFGWFMDYPAPSAIIEPLLSCGAPLNYGRFCDRSIDTLAERASKLQTSDPRAAYDLWARVDRRLTDAGAWVPIVSGFDVAFLSERVRNFQVSEHSGPLYSQIWVR